MKRIALTLLAVAFLASISIAKDDKAKEPKAQKISGWVSDEKCAAKGDNADHAACAKKCAEAGTPLVVVSDSDKKVYKVDNQDALKGHEGHHVKVTGHVNGDSMHVENVAMLKQPKAKEEKSEHKGL